MAKSGPDAYDPMSKTQQRIAKRTEGMMTGPMKDRRDRFIDALLRGDTKREAAMYAGVPARSASKEASTMWREPYVQQRLRELREALNEDELLTRKELVLNVKQIAFDDKELGGVRVGASALLARVMGFEAAKKLDVDLNHRGGIMLVPVMGSVADWEQAAAESQKRLKDEVRT